MNCGMVEICRFQSVVGSCVGPKTRKRIVRRTKLARKSYIYYEPRPDDVISELDSPSRFVRTSIGRLFLTRWHPPTHSRLDPPIRSTTFLLWILSFKEFAIQTNGFSFHTFFSIKNSTLLMSNGCGPTKRRVIWNVWCLLKRVERIQRMTSCRPFWNTFSPTDGSCESVFYFPPFRCEAGHVVRPLSLEKKRLTCCRKCPPFRKTKQNNKTKSRQRKCIQFVF